jgi:hypothetical protein
MPKDTELTVSLLTHRPTWESFATTIVVAAIATQGDPGSITLFVQPVRNLDPSRPVNRCGCIQPEIIGFRYNIIMKPFGWELPIRQHLGNDSLE